MIGAIISLAVLLMVGVLILGQFQTQVETNEAALGDDDGGVAAADMAGAAKFGGAIDDNVVLAG